MPAGRGNLKVRKLADIIRKDCRQEEKIEDGALMSTSTFTGLDDEDELAKDIEKKQGMKQEEDRNGTVCISVYFSINYKLSKMHIYSCN